MIRKGRIFKKRMYSDLVFYIRDLHSILNQNIYISTMISPGTCSELYTTYFYIQVNYKVIYIRCSLCQIMKILLIIIFWPCNCQSCDCRSSVCHSSVSFKCVGQVCRSSVSVKCVGQVCVGQVVVGQVAVGQVCVGQVGVGQVVVGKVSATRSFLYVLAEFLLEVLS
jgi:hypothetical protein